MGLAAAAAAGAGGAWPLLVVEAAAEVCVAEDEEYEAYDDADAAAPSP